MLDPMTAAGLSVGDVVTISAGPRSLWRRFWFWLWHIRFYDGIDWDMPQCFVVTHCEATVIEFDNG